MPILFNGNGLDSTIWEEDFIPRGKRYVRAVVKTLRNEPPCNDLILYAPDEETKKNWYAKIRHFVRRDCAYVQATMEFHCDLIAASSNPYLVKHLRNCMDVEHRFYAQNHHMATKPHCKHSSS